MLESWDSLKKNCCLESEPTLKMNLTSWTSLQNILTYANTEWEIGKLEDRKIRILKIRISDFPSTRLSRKRGRNWCGIEKCVKDWLSIAYCFVMKLPRYQDKVQLRLTMVLILTCSLLASCGMAPSVSWSWPALITEQIQPPSSWQESSRLTDASQLPEERRTEVFWIHKLNMKG